MYDAYFGFSQPPFRMTPDTRLFFPGGGRGEILEALIYAITSGEGIVKVVGEIGTGKTMMCRMLEERLPENVEVVYLANPSLSPDDILQAIAIEMELPVEPGANRLQVMHALQQRLLEKHARNRQVVMFVEEAQSMPIETLEEIRLLSNLETKRDKLLQIVLFGQPELDENLEQARIRQLKDRITHSFHLPPFSADETGAYLNHRMRCAGYKGPELFRSGTVRALARAADGLIRRINVLADKTLLAAYAEDTHDVLRRHVRAAIHDSHYRSSRRPRTAELAITIGGAICLAIIAWAVLQPSFRPWPTGGDASGTAAASSAAPAKAAAGTAAPVEAKGSTAAGARSPGASVRKTGAPETAEPAAPARPEAGTAPAAKASPAPAKAEPASESSTLAAAQSDTAAPSPPAATPASAASARNTQAAAPEARPAAAPTRAESATTTSTAPAAATASTASPKMQGAAAATAGTASPKVQGEAAAAGVAPAPAKGGPAATTPASPAATSAGTASPKSQGEAAASAVPAPAKVEPATTVAMTTPASATSPNVRPEASGDRPAAVPAPATVEPATTAAPAAPASASTAPPKTQPKEAASSGTPPAAPAPAKAEKTIVAAAAPASATFPKVQGEAAPSEGGAPVVPAKVKAEATTAVAAKTVPAPTPGASAQAQAPTATADARVRAVTPSVADAADGGPAGAEGQSKLGIGRLLGQRMAATRVWLERVDPGHYSIQLFLTGLDQRRAVEAFLQDRKRAGDLDGVFVYETMMGDRPVLGVLYGDYAAFEAAKRALGGLPAGLKRLRPFVRQLAEVSSVG